MLALYHFLRAPGKANFDVRMTSPIPHVYRITHEQASKDVLIFRTGKDWPCYCRVYLKANNTEFEFHHHHSSAKEEFHLSGSNLYSGRVTKESGLTVQFEGNFWNPKSLELREEYRLDNKLYAPKRFYEIDNAW
jgi:hypothetical protein